MFTTSPNFHAKMEITLTTEYLASWRYTIQANMATIVTEGDQWKSCKENPRGTAKRAIAIAIPATKPVLLCVAALHAYLLLLTAFVQLLQQHLQFPLGGIYLPCFCRRRGVEYWRQIENA